MATVSLRLEQRDYELLKEYARLSNTTVSKLLRDAAIEKIEAELDASLFDAALGQVKRTYSLDEVRKELDL